MKYSFIIPYRDRFEHLKVLIPTLMEQMEGEDFEVIVSEQNDDNNFQIACVQNIASHYADGDILVFHQVDYIPTPDGTDYDLYRGQPTLPVGKAVFLNQNGNKLRAKSDIPAGYRGFSEQVDPEFYGGVLCISRKDFDTINGFNPLYKGWGNEDEDVRERFRWAGIETHRGDGIFACLYHEDNGDMSRVDESKQKDFIEGRNYLNTQAYEDRHIGASSMSADVEWVTNTFTIKYANLKWLTSTNYCLTNGELI